MQTNPMRLSSLLALVSIPTIGFAQEVQPTKGATELIAEFAEASKAWMEQYRAASKEERPNLMATRPQPAKWFPKVLEAVAAAPEADGAVDAAAWMLGAGRAKGTDLEQVVGLLSKHHLNSPKLSNVVRALSRNPSGSVTKFLRTVEKQNESVAVKAQACLSLANQIKSRAGLAQSLKTADDKRKKMLHQFYGRQAVEILTAADPAELEKTAEKWFDKAVKNEDYASVTYGRSTIGATAKNNLFELRHLSIGKVAPEIVAEDIDGNPMKLSDYRGKVVVLDFWGDW